MIVAGIGCRTGVSAEAVLALVQEATSFLVALGLDPRVYPSGRPDGVGAPQGVGPRAKPEGDEVRAEGDDVGVEGDAAATTVIRGLDPRTYPLGRPDGAAAPQGVGPRVKPEGDDGRAVCDAAATSVIRGLDPRTYPSGRPDGVAAPQWVGPRVKPEGDEGRVGYEGRVRDGDVRAVEGAIHALAVPAFRHNEPGIAQAASRLGLPILWVEREALKGEQGRCLTRSARAEAETGLSCVAEAAALAAAGVNSRLVLPRIAGGGVTCALAEGSGRP